MNVGSVNNADLIDENTVRQCVGNVVDDADADDVDADGDAVADEVETEDDDDSSRHARSLFSASIMR